MSGRPRSSVDVVARLALAAAVVMAPLALGGRPATALAGLQLLVLASLLCWVAASLRAGQMEWRRTSLDVPLALLVGLVLLQLAIGNGVLARWALSPAPTGTVDVTPPVPVFLLGTAAPSATARALALFLTYIAVYALVVNLIRRRRHLSLLIRTVSVTATVLALLGLVDYFVPALHVSALGDPAPRVVATFANPDHFGAWLNMAVFLTLGYVLARGHARGSASREALSTADGIREITRRYAPVAGIGVMVVALVFTLSRGAILSCVVTLGAFIAVAAAMGAARRTVAVVAIVTAITAGVSAWIGLGPFVSRLQISDMMSRWTMYTAALPMLRDFPVLGVGLGAFEHVFHRYQPTALTPGALLLDYAHNDWLQVAIELGPVGAVLALVAVVRGATDLVGAHLLGRGRCPTGGGEGEVAERHDPYAVWVSLGAITAVLSLLVHSVVDFSARIPANGILGAACLGVATVALHSRFGSEERFLAGRIGWSPPRPHVARLVFGAASVVLALGAGFVLRPAVTSLLLWTRPPPADRLDTAIAIDGRDARTLALRAEARLVAADALLLTGTVRAGQPALSGPDRRGAAQTIADGAIDDFRLALRLTPTVPSIHERLAWAYLLRSFLSPQTDTSWPRLAFAHMNRAVSLAPANPTVHLAMTRLAVRAFPAVPVEPALRAARAAIEHDRSQLDGLVYELLLLPLKEADWLTLVPETFTNFIALGDALEQRGLVREATTAYRRAIDLAKPDEAPLAHWVLGLCLFSREEYRAALIEHAAAAKQDGDNPEVYLAMAQTLERMRDLGALDLYRAAIVKVEALVQAGRPARIPFNAEADPLRGVVLRRIGGVPPTLDVRYRRAMARHLTQREFWQQALKEWDLVVAATPRDADANFLRAETLRGLGHLEPAVAAYRTATDLDPANVGYRMRLAQVLWDTRQPFQAIAEWNAVLATEPGHLDAALAVARAHLQAGAKEEAFRDYERVFRIAPDNQEARRALVRFGWTPR